MNHHRKTTASHRRRSLQKIRYPKFRYTMVGLLPTSHGNKPMILLSGEWLREFGFVLNQRLKVFSSQGKIVIEGLWNEPEPKINVPDHSPPDQSSIGLLSGGSSLASSWHARSQSVA